MNDILQNETSAPPWADFFNATQYAVFLTLVQAELQQKGFTVDLQDGVAFIQNSEAKSLQLGLQNLAQMCFASGESNWEATIAKHFAIMLQRNSGQGWKEAPFSEVSALLKLRVFSSSLPAEAMLVGYPIAPGLEAVLALDLPDSVVTVSPTQIEKWGISREVALALGLENALREPVRKIVLTSENGPTLQGLHEESFFVSTRLLRMEDWVAKDHPNGALVSVPCRDLVLFHPIEGIEAVRAVSEMLFTTNHFFRRGPGSISRDLFWWREGKLTLLPSEERDGSFSFAPPGEFLDCLNRIASPS